MRFGRICAHRAVLALAALLLFSSAARAQVYSDTLSIYFPQGRSAFDRSYASNGSRFDSFVTTARRIIDGHDGKLHSLRFEASCSPEGGRDINTRLVNARSLNV